MTMFPDNEGESYSPLRAMITNWPDAKYKDIETITKTVNLVPGDTDAQLLVPHSLKRRRAILVASVAKGYGNVLTSGDIEGTVTNPGAGATIASINGTAFTAIAPNGGFIWQVQWQLSLQGTVTAADANNMRLTSPLGTTQEIGLFGGVAGNYPQESIQIPLPANQGINVQAIAAASGASAIYGAQISASPIIDLNQAFCWIARTKSDAQKQGGAFFTPSMDPIPLIGTTELWAMIDPTATTPMSISVYSEVERD